MAILDGHGRGKKRAPSDPVSNLLAGCFGPDPEAVLQSSPEKIFESGELGWDRMVSLLDGKDSPGALLLFKGSESEEGIKAFAERLVAAGGLSEAHIIRHMPAEAWRIELERRRMGGLQCRVDKAGALALLLDEGLARIAAESAKQGDGEWQGVARSEGEPGFLDLDHPALLALPGLFCPREWTAGTAQASVSWTRLKAFPASNEESLRWTGAWSAGAAKTGFYLELKPPSGADVEAVAKTMHPILATAWKEAWPGLGATLPGISSPAFGRSPSKAGKAELAIEGRLLVGAATLDLSLLLPAALLRYFPAEAMASVSEGSAPKDAGPIERFLEVNDCLFKNALIAHKPLSGFAGRAEDPGTLPTLPALLALFSEHEMARLVQSYFLPEHGALGFQALFFHRKAGEKDKPGKALPVLPFDERRIIAALPAASREEWIEARKAGLPSIHDGADRVLDKGSEALKGLWEAHRKHRIELGHGGKSLLTEALGERLEAAERARLDALVAKDLPLSLIEGLDRPLTKSTQTHRAHVRRVLDRLSARELALATWGSTVKRPLMDASLSRGKQAELKAEAAILARRLGTGEEGAGEVAEAREELVRKVTELLKSMAAE